VVRDLVEEGRYITGKGTTTALDVGGKRRGRLGNPLGEENEKTCLHPFRTEEMRRSGGWNISGPVDGGNREAGGQSKGG